MDKYLRKFILISILIIGVFVWLLMGFGYIYQNFTIYTYNYILLIAIMVTILLILLFALTVLGVFITYQNRRVSSGARILVAIGLKVLLPLVLFVSEFVKSDRDLVRRLFIEVNNIQVLGCKKKYLPDKLLILLPHCLQNTGCGYKVTNAIGNCRECGRCCIGDIAKIASSRNIPVCVVTGGTAARNIVAKSRPQLIVSIACERDLVSGIADVRGIPVIGIINERPQGPCFNTTLNLDTLEQTLDDLLA